MDRHCFVIQRFDGERYDQRFFDVIKPIVESCQLMAYRIDQDPAVDNIIETVMEKIRSAALVIAEISTDRPNVWFELGYAMALSKPVIMLCDNTRTEIPFDIRQQNILFYRTGSISDYEQLKRQLRERITVKIGIGNNIQNLTATDISVLKRMAIHQRTENTINEKKLPGSLPTASFAVSCLSNRRPYLQRPAVLCGVRFSADMISQLGKKRTDPVALHLGFFGRGISINGRGRLEQQRDRVQCMVFQLFTNIRPGHKGISVGPLQNGAELVDHRHRDTEGEIIGQNGRAPPVQLPRYRKTLGIKQSLIP